MPTPMPIMAAISGREVRDGEDVREELQQRDADAEPGQRGDHGQAHGHHGPEGEQHDEDGGGDADALARPGRRRGGGARSGCRRARPGSPSCAAACAVVMTFLTAAVGMSAVSVVNWTWAKAMLPLLGRRSGGRRRPRTGWSRSGRRAAARRWPPPWSMAAWLAGAGDRRRRVEDDVGGVARLRREASPARCCVACCDGVLPAVNLFSKWVPTTWARTVMPMMARIHSARTVRRRS